MVLSAVGAALASGAKPVIAVVGHQAARVRVCLPAEAVIIVDNKEHRQGVSTSIRAAIEALPADIDGALFMLADMPRVTAPHVDRLIAAFEAAAGRTVCVPTFDGRRGNPVLWPARHFAGLRALTGDVGGRALFASHADAVLEVAMPDDGVLFDIDRPQAWLGADPGRSG